MKEHGIAIQPEDLNVAEGKSDWLRFIRQKVERGCTLLLVTASTENGAIEETST
jgi:hypothetical protein